MGEGVIRRLWRYLAVRRWLLAGVVLAAVGYVLGAVLGPFFIGRTIDGIVGRGQVDFAVMAWNLLYLGISAAGSAALQWAMLAGARRLSAEVARELRGAAFNAINAAPLAQIDQSAHGDVVSRLVNDADALGEGLLQAVSQLIPGVVTILATIVVMLTLSVPIALMVIVITPLSVLFARFIARRTSSMFRAQSAALGALSAQVNETVREQALVQAFGYEEEAAQQYAESNEAYFTANFKATVYSSLANPGTRFINALVYLAVGLFGSILAIGGGITIGGVSAFLSYANQYTRPFNEVSAVLTQMQSAVASAERLFVLIDWVPEKPDAPDAQSPQRAAGDVEAQGVYFSYHKNRALLQDISFAAQSGQRLALVGPTGCGKTTLINLLMRFYEVDAGQITVDGQPATEIRRDALRGLYGMVLQDTWLKQASVRDNIAYARPDASDEEVQAAARAALAHRFILRLPNGYDTVLDSGGENLSAGQRQLLCIARIMLAKPDMLLLDEATSNIDTRTEMLIQQALEKLMAGHTSFIVAHRLSTIENADLILVMNEGRIIERGRHRQLLADGGFYAGLYHSQFGPAAP